MKENNGLHVIKTNKFKDIGISIRFINELSSEHASEKSLLAMMICDRCLKYPSKKEMSDITDELYGASLNAQTMGYGKAQILDIRSKIIDPDFVSGGFDLLEAQFAFLHEIIFRPRLDQEVMKEAKEILLAKLQRMQDEPSQYAIHRGLELAGADSYLGISALGNKERIEAITMNQLQEAYEKMLSEDQIEVLICGDVDREKIEELIQKYLKFSNVKHRFSTFYSAESSMESKRIEEYRDITQTNIFMLYFTNTSINDPDYWKLKVANAILGQYPTSFLFQEVREKNSLCYSVFSNLISYDGALGITTGVEKENIDKTIQLIETQFERVKKGDFDEELMKTSKGMLINNLRSSKDEMNSLFALKFQNILLKQDLDVKDFIGIINEVSKEDVMRVMEKCVHKLTYVLTKEENA